MAASLTVIEIFGFLSMLKDPDVREGYHHALETPCCGTIVPIIRRHYCTHLGESLDVVQTLGLGVSNAWILEVDLVCSSQLELHWA